MKKKTAKQDFPKLFANSSQPLRISQCVSNQFRIAKFNSPSTLYLCEIRLSQNLSKISHCQIRNLLATLANFAMPISQCQFRNANFAMPISQGQYTVHLSHLKHQNLSEISHCEIRKPHCEFRKPLCEFRKPLCQIRNPLPNSQTTLPTSLALRNSHLQALSSSVINATDFQTW